MVGDETTAYLLPEAIAQAAERRKVELEAVLTRSRDDFAGRAREVELRVVVGHPANALVRAAAEPDIDLVVGARGLGRFARLLLGSVSERVLHRAACPVLVVK